MQINSKKTILFLSILSFFLTIEPSATNSYMLLPLIPLFFGILYSTLFPKNIKKGPGLTIMTLVLSLRYLLFPPVFKSSNYNFHKYDGFVNEAIFLMIFEMIVIFATIAYFYKKKKSNQLATSSVNFEIPKTIPLTLLVLGLVILVTNPNIYANRHFITNSKDMKNELIEVSGAASQFMKWAELYVIIFFVIKLRNKATIKKSFFLMSLSLIVLVTPALFFKGSSRLSLLIPLVTIYFIIGRIYGIKAKQIQKIVLIYGVLAITFLSTIKFFNTSSIAVASSLIVTDSASILNAYFGGLPNVLTGLDTYAHHGQSISIFFNDIFMNGMGISQFFSSQNNSIALFNSSFYSGILTESQDQIPPTITQGLLYGGYLFCAIPTIIMVYTTLYSDEKFKYTSKIDESYIYASFAVMIGWAVPGNLTHLASMAINTIIPLLILIKLNHLMHKVH